MICSNSCQRSFPSFKALLSYVAVLVNWNCAQSVLWLVLGLVINLDLLLCTVELLPKAMALYIGGLFI